MPKFEFLGVNGSIQTLKSGNTSLLIYGKEGSFLIDVSCNIVKAVNVNIDAIILTHEHIDHIYAFPSLIHQMWLSGRRKKLFIYTSYHLKKLIQKMIELFNLDTKKGMFEYSICTDKYFSVGSMKIELFKTLHTLASIGVVVKEEKETLLYTSDTSPLFEEKLNKYKPSILIHEATGRDENATILHEKGHSSGADAGKLAKALQVKKLYLCHLPPNEIEQEEICKEAKKYFSETYIPEILNLYF